MEGLNPLRAGDDIDEDDAPRLDPGIQQDADGLLDTAPCGQHGVTQEDIAGGDIGRQVGVDEAGQLLGGGLVTLDQDFTW